MARDLIANARLYLSEAEQHFQHGHWHVCVRRSQETIEATTKAALRIVGVEPPRLHDMSDVLGAESARFLDCFAQRLPDIRGASAKYRQDRELSYYGDERHGIPPSRLYDRARAQAALEAARDALDACSRLVTELTSSA